MVGWDLPCEHLNAYITHAVQLQVSPEAIDKAVKLYPLFQHNHAIFSPTSKEHMMKDMDADVQILKEALKKEIGSDWRAATAHRAVTPWTNTQNQRGQAPWLEVQAMMTRRGNDSVARFIANNKARQLTSSYYAFAP